MKDQGAVPACVGFACWQLLASEPVVDEDAESISGFQLYGEARKIDEFDDASEGTSVRAGLNVLKNMGFISSYHWTPDQEEAVHYLLTTGPLILGVGWRTDMFSPNAQGLITVSGRMEGGHAIFCPSADWQNKVVTLQNSWGTGWGRGGSCHLSFEGLDYLLKEGGCAAACVE